MSCAARGRCLGGNAVLLGWWVGSWQEQGCPGSAGMGMLELPCLPGWGSAAGAQSHGALWLCLGIPLLQPGILLATTGFWGACSTSEPSFSMFPLGWM